MSTPSISLNSVSLFRVLAKAIVLALIPSMTGYLYLHLLRQLLIEAEVSNVWTYYLGNLLTQLTTTGWLLVCLRGEITPFEWRNIAHYLTLDRVDWRGLLYVLPLFILLVAVVAANLAWLGLPPTVAQLEAALAEISGPTAIAAGALALAILLATLFAEESYFRVFLMNRLAPLGIWDWIVAGLLFALYHWYALPWPFFLTIPLPLGLLAGLVFKWRQNIYPLMLLHLLAVQAGNVAVVLMPS